MYAIRPEKLFKMLDQLVSRHKGEITRAFVDWDKVEIKHARSGEKVEQFLPLLVLDFAV